MVASNHSNHLLLMSSDTFGVHRVVTLNNATLRLAEVEWINELVWSANEDDDVLRAFDLSTGEHLYSLDVSALAPHHEHGCPTCFCSPPRANGIAFDAADEKFYVSGRYWYV